MTRSTFCALLSGLILLNRAASAQVPFYDPHQLPTFHGTVEMYILSQCDQIDGFFIDNSLEVHVAPRLSSELAHAVRPGDPVTVHGLKASDLPIVQALSVTNAATGAEVNDTFVLGWPGPINACPEPRAPLLEAKGRVKHLTHDFNGNVNGAVLDDGTVIRFAQGLTLQDPDCLVPGRNIAADGPGIAGALGSVLAARSPISLVPAVPDDRSSVQLRCMLVAVNRLEDRNRKLPLINPPAKDAPSGR